MPVSDDLVQSWYANQLHDFYYDRYLAYRGYTVAGELRASNPTEDIYPSPFELSRSATLAELDGLPDEVRESHAFYHAHFNEQDIGSACVFIVPVDSENTYAVRTTTDGDDGYLEIFDDAGTLLACGRTNLDVVAWGTRDWLRDQVAKFGEFPPEMKDAVSRSCWGQPLPWDCQVVCWQCQARGCRGYCTKKAGHREEAGDAHCCNAASHAWDDTPPDPRVFVKPQFELRMRDGSAVVGTLPEYRLTLNTLHGPVNAYANDVRKIDFAPTNSHDVSSTIALAIHRLGSAQPDEVQSAEGELMAAGARAFQALVAAAQCGKGALQRRARALAARIQQNVAAEFLNLRTQHQVTLRDGTITCALDPFVFGLMTPEGYKSFELYDVHTLTQFPGQAIDAPRDNPRWLGRFYTNWYGAKLSFLVTGNTDDGDVFGSNPYTLDSMLATAAVHAGLVQPGETKVVRVEIMLAPPTFVGSERNGVTSLDWEEPVAGAFRFIE